jgi:hypothetical protein
MGRKTKQNKIKEKKYFFLCLEREELQNHDGPNASSLSSKAL